MNLMDKISKAFANVGVDNEPVPQSNGLEFYDTKEKRIFSCEVSTSRPTSDIDRFLIQDKRQGQKLSTIALNAIAQHFWDSGSRYIAIHLVRNDGLTFWPRFGAIPSQGAPSYRSYTPFFMEEEFIETEGDKLLNAFLIAKNDPIEAWFYLTDPKTIASRDLIARLNSGSKDQTMHMDLEHPVVRERLGLENL